MYFKEGMNEISFSGIYKKPVTIKKYVNGQYKPFQASIVKAEESDINALQKVRQLWNRQLLNMILAEPQYLNKSKHVYILTKQKDNFKNLNPEDILAMAELREDKYCAINTLEAIQVHPDIEKTNITIFSRFKNYIMKKLNKDSKNFEYKEVGTNLVKTIQEYHSDKVMDLCPINTAAKFYKKLGFKSDNPYFYCMMTWTPPAKK